MMETIKAAIDRVEPCFRHSAITEDGTPRLVVFMMDGVTHAAVDCVSNRVFGAGHLSIDRWWVEGGDGACLKTDAGMLDEVGQDVIPGFLHFQRFGLPNTPFGIAQKGVEDEVRSFFSGHPEEFSCFIEVEFVRTDSEMHPWRARRRRS